MIWNKIKTDNITAELLQCARTNIKDALYQITRNIHEKGDVPDDYCKSTIVTIPKKSGANSCEQNTESTDTRLKIPNENQKPKNWRKSGEVIEKRPIWKVRRQKGTREAILGLPIETKHVY